MTKKDITAGNTIPQNNQESPTTAPTTSSGHGKYFLFVDRLRNQSIGLLIAAIGFAALFCLEISFICGGINMQRYIQGIGGICVVYFCLWYVQSLTTTSVRIAKQ